MAEPDITAEIIQVELLKDIPKGTYKVLTAPAAVDAVKEFNAKHSGKYGMPARIFQLRSMYYFPVDIDGSTAYIH